MKKIISVFLLSLFVNLGYNQEELQEEISMEQLQEYMEYAAYADSIDSTFVYQTGKVLLENGVASVNVPKGYKFLSAKQSKYVLSELWGNPPEETLGLLFPEGETPMGDNTSYAVEISYSEDGYVKDDDAEDIDYDDLLDEMKKDQVQFNIERAKQGYENIEIVGWASSPYYDKEAKKLHWAKELKFANNGVNTLNYNIRVLGRKGYLMLNAIGNIDVLPEFNRDIDEILESVEFEKGYRYDEFDPSFDNVAAYGIGGLVAGKVLAKVGFFALVLKFWKIIALAVVGFFAAFKNKLFKPKNNLPANNE